jgi:hypothetical protein
MKIITCSFADSLSHFSFTLHPYLPNAILVERYKAAGADDGFLIFRLTSKGKQVQILYDPVTVSGK